MPQRWLVCKIRGFCPRTIAIILGPLNFANFTVFYQNKDEPSFYHLLVSYCIFLVHSTQNYKLYPTLLVLLMLVVIRVTRGEKPTCLHVFFPSEDLSQPRGVSVHLCTYVTSNLWLCMHSDHSNCIFICQSNIINGHP